MCCCVRCRMLNYITKKGASSAQRLGIVGMFPFLQVTLIVTSISTVSDRIVI